METDRFSIVFKKMLTDDSRFAIMNLVQSELYEVSLAKAAFTRV